jgi:hypothetical protein
MPVMRRLLLGSAPIILAMAVTGQQTDAYKTKPACKGNKEVIGECFQVRGRAFASNGTPDLRIWRVRTKRILGVTASADANDSDESIAPENLFRALGGEQHFVFGDFEVCPFTREREAHMQMVCIERAEHLFIKPYGYGAKKQ